MNRTIAIAALLLVGCSDAASTIGPDPDVRPETEQRAEDASSPEATADTPTSPRAGVDPVQLEVREVACDSRISNAAGSITWHAAVASYPGLTKYQLLESVHVMLVYDNPDNHGGPSGYHTPTIPSVKDGSVVVTCGSAAAPAPTYKVAFVRRP
jgi:hypothetical protein